MKTIPDILILLGRISSFIFIFLNLSFASQQDKESLDKPIPRFSEKLIEKLSESLQSNNDLRSKLALLYAKHKSSLQSSSLEGASKISIFWKDDQSEEIKNNTFNEQNLSQTPLSNSLQNNAKKKISREKLKQFPGQIKAYFKNKSPTYGTGVLIDFQHVLTSAACVFRNKQPPESVVFFSYSAQGDLANQPLEIKFITVLEAYRHDFSEKAAVADYALLTLKSRIELPLETVFPVFYEKNDQSMTLQDDSFFLRSFEGISKKLKDFPLKNIQEKDNFFFYHADTREGASGSPVFAQGVDNNYYLIGIHSGNNPHPPLETTKRALILNPSIQTTLQHMKEGGVQTWKMLALEKNDQEAL